MTHFNPEIAGTEIETNIVPVGENRLVTKAERARSLTGMLLGVRQSKPQAILSAEPEPPAILELVEAPGPSGTPGLIDCAMPDPLIQGLVDLLPRRNSVWSLDDRGKWLSAASSIFCLIYKIDDGTPR